MVCGESTEQLVKKFMNKCKLLGIDTEGWKFSNDYETVIRYTGTCKEVIVPPVKYIGEGCFKFNYIILSIKIPHTVISIGDNAFAECRNLKSLMISNSVESIGKKCFLNCTDLQSIDVEKSSRCYCSLNGILFNRDMTEIITYPPGKEDANYTIPDTVIKIGHSAFDRCVNIKSISMSDNVTIISDEAFCRCKHLKSITLSHSIKIIGSDAFQHCKGIESIVIPDGVINISEGTFYSCRGLKYITIPDSVVSIGDEAFCFCTSIESINLPSNLRKIGDRAFSDCDNLRYLTIPDSVKDIGEEAFYIRRKELNGQIYNHTITIQNENCKLGDSWNHGRKTIKRIEIISEHSD